MEHRSRKQFSTGKPIDTKQARREIEKLVRNVFPRTHVSFIASADPGMLSFEIIGSDGMPKTQPIVILAHHRRRFTRAWLIGAVKAAAGAKGRLA